MSNSDAILYTLILWIFNILSKVWFPRVDLKLFWYRYSPKHFWNVGDKPFSFHDLRET